MPGAEKLSVSPMIGSSPAFISSLPTPCHSKCWISRCRRPGLKLQPSICHFQNKRMLACSETVPESRSTWRVTNTVYGPRVAFARGSRGSRISKRTDRWWPRTSRGCRVAEVAAIDSQPKGEVNPFPLKTCKRHRPETALSTAATSM